MKRKDFLKAGALGAATLLSAPSFAHSGNEEKPRNKNDEIKNVNSPQSSKHLFNLERDGKVAVDNSGGKIKLMNGKMFPILEGLTFYLVEMKKGGLREPHWHPNSHELNFVINGKAKIGVLSANNERDEQICEPGDTFFIPKGYFHYIENVNDGDTKLIVAFSDANPEDLGLSAAYGFLSNDMLAQTLDTSPSSFENIPKATDSLLLMGKNK